MMCCVNHGNKKKAMGPSCVQISNKAVSTDNTYLYQININKGIYWHDSDELK